VILALQSRRRPTRCYSSIYSLYRSIHHPKDWPKSRWPVQTHRQPLNSRNSVRHTGLPNPYSESS